MTLLFIVLATFAGGLLSVVIAASMTLALLARVVQGMISLSAGVLLGTALLHLLPEAFETGTDPHQLFLTLLGGLLFFFLLEKAELYRHSHPHGHGDSPPTPQTLNVEPAGRGGLSVLLGDGIHNFCDGVIVAAAFLTDPKLGLLTSLAIIAHEIPQEVGDFIVLLNFGLSRRRALAYNAVSGLAAVLGGLVGYVVVGPWQSLFPYLLVIASSSFVYVAVADLLPQLQRRLPWRETASQLGWLATGPLVVVLARNLSHAA
jgi:zinc and cadmium transporter